MSATPAGSADGDPGTPRRIDSRHPPTPQSAPAPALWHAVRAGPRRFLTSAWPWRCWAYLFSGALAGPLLLVLLTAVLLVGLGLTVVAGAGLAVLAGGVLGAIPVAALERRRLRLVDPDPVPRPHAPLPGAGPLRRARVRLRERATWRALGYALLLAVVLGTADLGFLVLLAFSCTLIATPVIVVALAPEPVMIPAGHTLSGPLEGLIWTAAGCAALVACAYLGALLAGVQAWTARLLLSAREDDPGARVLELTRSRARLADAFEAERRRIERDLHDGAQQQLVALSITLGMAKLVLDSGNGDAKAAALVERARTEARDALDRLRDLVRGIHPQVLTDHGLGAAVHEVAARHPIPVHVDIDIAADIDADTDVTAGTRTGRGGRPPAPVETMAYFTVVEALANAARHAPDAAVTVHARRSRGRLVLSITDDGPGGADPDAGTGLRGLADRLAVLNGTLVLTSPVGGPTRIRVEIPCSA